MNKMNIVGIGPGDREYLTLGAIETIEKSDVLVGSQRSLDLFDYLDAKMVVLEPRDIPKTVKMAVSYLDDGLKVSVLSTGDPGFSGMLKTIQKLSPKTKVNVIPGISSVQLAAAKVQIPWDTANLLTIHGGKAPTDDLLEKYIKLFISNTKLLRTHILDRFKISRIIFMCVIVVC